MDRLGWTKKVLVMTSPAWSLFIFMLLPYYGLWPEYVGFQLACAVSLFLIWAAALVSGVSLAINISGDKE